MKGSTRIVIIILAAVALLALISLLPLNRWSGGKLNDFNLLSDLFPSESADSIESADFSAPVDPALADTLTESNDSTPLPTFEEADTVIPEPQAPRRDDGMVAIEDYTMGGRGLARLRQALASGSTARIAVVGDSYIEGDIFTQDLRRLMQDTYGGEGVGYMNLHSKFPGFRRTVTQSGSGWVSHDPNDKCNTDYLWLAEQYFTLSGKATSKYKGVKSLPHLARWNRSQFLLIAPQGATITLTTDSANETFEFSPSPDVQSVELSGTTSMFEISTSAATAPSLTALGVWLDSPGGVSVDCMSSRGFSGVTLTKISATLSAQMRRWIDYDLIVLEFGINAMSPGQKQFTSYANRITRVVEHIRTCYPNADILLMGIGDRGQKRDGVIRSVVAAPYMVATQRDVARHTRCLFWDTREAQGGEDAIVRWTREGLANKDYIHMTHKGGERLARLFFDALQDNLQQ